MSRSNGYLPLPDCVTIHKSKIHGLGLFATEEIPKGTDLGITHVADDRFKGGLIRLPLGGFINHSNSPNVILVVDKDTNRVKTLRHTKKW